MGEMALLLRKLKRQYVIQIMALLGLAWMVVFNYIPMAGIYVAFSDYNVAKPMFSAPWAGLKYFEQFMADPKIYEALVNTLGISMLNIAIGFPVPILFAILLNELGSLRYKRVVQTVSYLPHFVSWVILGGFLINWSSETGLINDLLKKAGLIDRPIYLLGDPKYFWGLAVGSGIWKEMGWGAIIYIAAIAGINPELYEVATIDGANRFQRIIHITLPCIKGTIAILFTFTVAGLLNSNFEQIFVLKNTLNASASTVLDIYVYQVGMRLARYSYATAVGLLKSVVALILLIVSNRVSDKLTGASFI
jgi:putative aldouronate transport system permease protein